MPSSVPIFRPSHEVTIQRCALAHPHRPSTLLPSPVFRHNFSLFRRRRARVSTFSSDYSRPPVRSYENTPNHGAAAFMDVNSPPPRSRVRFVNVVETTRLDRDASTRCLLPLPFIPSYFDRTRNFTRKRVSKRRVTTDGFPPLLLHLSTREDNTFGN